MAMDVQSGNQEFRKLHAFPFLSSRLDCQGGRDIGTGEGETRELVASRPARLLFVLGSACLCQLSDQGNRQRSFGTKTECSRARVVAAEFRRLSAYGTRWTITDDDYASRVPEPAVPASFRSESALPFAAAGCERRA
jgi:hypothetical protein